MNRTKPITKNSKRVYNSYKTSDRRAASGYRPDQYLNSNNKSKVDVDTITKLKSNHIEEDKAIIRKDPKTGKTWLDSSLVEWNPNHYRLFVGNIGIDVTEEILIETFIKYPSLSKVKIPKDSNNQKQNVNKGFAFISFADPEDYLKCYKEMNGKYVGSKPITLERAKTEIGDVVKVNKKNNRYK